MTRTQMLLAGLLVAQILVIAVGGAASGPSSESVETRPFLPALDSFSPGRIEIAAESGDKVVTLSRKGQEWSLDEAGGYPVKASSVDGLLDRLKGLEVRRPVVATSRYHASLKVTDDEFERRVRLFKEGEEDPEVEFFMGTSENYRITHCRLAGEDEVYPVGDLGIYDVRAERSGWVEMRFTDWPFDEVTRFRLENAEGVLELERTGEGWKAVTPEVPEGRTLSKTQVDSLVRTAAGLSIFEPVGPVDEEAQGFKVPAATVTLTLQAKAEEPPAGEEEAEAAAPEPRVEVLRIGALARAKEDEETEDRYVARSGFDFAATARGYNVRRFLETTLEDLLEEPPPEQEPSADEDPPPGAPSGEEPGAGQEAPGGEAPAAEPPGGEAPAGEGPGGEAPGGEPTPEKGKTDPASEKPGGGGEKPGGGGEKPGGGDEGSSG